MHLQCQQVRVDTVLLAPLLGLLVQRQDEVVGHPDLRREGGREGGKGGANEMTGGSQDEAVGHPRKRRLATPTFRVYKEGVDLG